jgi:hypothetical protein
MLPYNTWFIKVRELLDVNDKLHKLKIIGQYICFKILWKIYFKLVFSEITEPFERKLVLHWVVLNKILLLFFFFNHIQKWPPTQDIVVEYRTRYVEFVFFLETTDFNLSLIYPKPYKNNQVIPKWTQK